MQISIARYPQVQLVLPKRYDQNNKAPTICYICLSVCRFVKGNVCRNSHIVLSSRYLKTVHLKPLCVLLNNFLKY